MKDDGTEEPTRGAPHDSTASSEHGTRGGQVRSPDVPGHVERVRLADRRTPGDRRSPGRGSRRLTVRLFFLAVVVVVLLALPRYLTDRRGTFVEAPPAELLGTWTTGAPRYTGRFIRIERDRLTLGLGGGVEESYPVQAIEVETEEIQRHYHVLYTTTDGADEELEVFVFDDGLMRLKNPSEVRWTRRAN